MTSILFLRYYVTKMWLCPIGGIIYVVYRCILSYHQSATATRREGGEEGEREGGRRGVNMVVVGG